MKRSSFITWEQLRVGVVILVAMLVMSVAVFKLGQAANLFTRRYPLYVFLPNANGLLPGAQVTVAGQIAGTVKEIDFLPVDADTTRNLKVTLSIDAGVRQQIRANSKATLRTMGLLGDKVLDITPGTPRYDVLAAGDTVPVGQSLDYEQVIAQASAAVGDLVQLTHDMKSITGGIVRGEGTMGQLVTNRSLYDELTATLTRTNQLMARLQNPNGTMGRMLDDPALYNRLVSTMASADSLLIALNSRDGSLGKLLRDTTLYQSLVGMAQRGDSLVRMLSNGNGLASKLLTDQQLYDQVLKLTTDLNAILADVRRDPRRYTKGMIKVF